MTTTLTPLPSGLWSLTLIADDGTEQVIEARDGGGLTLEQCERVLDEITASAELMRQRTAGHHGR